MTAGSRTVLGGLGALIKSALLLVGVPLSLVRLWTLAPALPRPIVASTVATTSGIVHIVLLAVGVVWVWAAAALIRELVIAITRRDGSVAGSWSHRWAAAIAGLFLAFSAGSAVATGFTHSAPPAAVTSERRALSDRPPLDASMSRPPLPTVRSGECLADVAERVFGERGAWPAIAQKNLGRVQIDGTRFVDPNLVRPGWCLDLPSASSATTTEITATPGRNRSVIGELGLLGLGIIATAATARRVRSLRRLGESGRTPGSRADRPPRRVAAVHASIEPFADSRLIEWIDGALRLASTAPGDLPDVRLVRAGPFGVEMLLAEANEAPPSPMTASDGGRWWVLEAADLGDPEALAPADGRIAPWLVPVGEDADAVYLVAVGPGRHLVIEGAAAQVDQAMRGVVAGLRSLPWAGELNVELLGIDPPPPQERCYHLLATTAETLTHMSTRPRAPRRGTSRPTWRQEPLVVAVDRMTHGLDEELLSRVVLTAGVVSDRGPGTDRLRLEADGGATLDPYAIALRTPLPNEAQGALLERLFAAASSTVSLTPAPVPATSVDPVPGVVDLQLLGGSPELIGWTTPPPARDRARVVEMLAFLSLHEHRSTTTEIGRALFGREEDVRIEPRVHALVAAVRTLLPRTGDGTELITVGHDGTVELSDAVTSDWDRVRHLIARASAGSPESALRDLSRAIGSLAPGSAIDHRSPYRWLDADGIGPDVRATVIDGAHHLATLAFAHDDLAMATDAISAGLLIDPLSEIVVRDAMVLADRRDDRAEVEATYRTLERALDALASAEPSGETRALHRALIDRDG